MIMQILDASIDTEVTPDPYDYSLILSIDYIIPIVQMINTKCRKETSLAAGNILKLTFNFNRVHA